MFLKRQVEVIHRSSVYLIIQSNGMNKKLWSLDVYLRNNGVICPRTIFCLLNIQPFLDNTGQVPCIESPDNAIILRSPDIFLDYAIDCTIMCDEMRAFILNAGGATLKVNTFNLLETSCAGAFCNKQCAYNTKSGCRKWYVFEKNKQHMGIELRIIVIEKDGVQPKVDVAFDDW